MANTLSDRLAKAGVEIGGRLKADKANQEQRYRYVSADKILAVCGQEMFRAGVALIPAITGKDLVAIDRGNGKSRFDVTVTFDMRLSCEGEALLMPWVGIGSDYSAPDKALYKAITSGHKYFMSKLFCIGEGNEDPEHEEAERSERTTDQLSRDLGYEPAAQKPAPKPAVPAMPPEMTVEQAEAIVNGQGTPYGQIPTEKITFALTSIRRKLETEPSPEYTRKARALEIILDARRAGRPVQQS